MLLVLKVTSCRGLPPSEEISACFDQRNGTIGRAADNDLVLPDSENFISRCHANISYEDGRYSISDTSLSGTVIDQSETPLKRSSTELREGMRIDIGEYELVVQITEAAATGPFPDELDSDGLLTEIIPDLGHSVPEGGTPRSFTAEESALESPAILDSDDPLAELEKDSPVPDHFDPPGPRFEPGGFDEPEKDFNDEDLLNDQSARQSGLQSEAASSPLPGDDLSPEDQFDFERSSEALVDQPLDVAAEPRPEHGPEPKKPPVVAKEVPLAESNLPEMSEARPSVQPAKGESDRQKDQLFGVLIEAIGIDEASLTSGVSDENRVRLIGEMFREMVEGLMTLLMNRAELRSRFRMSVTTIRPVDNNPLKFSVSVTDALKALLTPGQKGFLKPIDAIQNGFDDVSNHQLAMISGIQASVNELLIKFDPEQFEKQIKAGVFSNKDAKCWKAYSKAYEQLVEEVTDEFFGDAFVKVYEKHLQILVSINDEK